MFLGTLEVAIEEQCKLLLMYSDDATTFIPCLFLYLFFKF